MLILNIYSACADLMALINLDKYQEEIDLIIFHLLRWSSLWLCHKKVALVLKYTFTDVAGLLVCLYTIVLKVLWCVPYWFAFIIHFKRSPHWPIFETGFGGITNSWSIKTGHINASSSNVSKNLWKHPWGSSFLENIY